MTREEYLREKMLPDWFKEFDVLINKYLDASNYIIKTNPAKQDEEKRDINK